MAETPPRRSGLRQVVGGSRALLGEGPLQGSLCIEAAAFEALAGFSGSGGHCPRVVAGTAGDGRL